MDEGCVNLKPTVMLQISAWTLINFLSFRVGAYSWVGAYFIATILQVVRYRYSNFCSWCKETQGNLISQVTMI